MPEYDPDHEPEYLPTEWVPREDIEPNDWNPNEMPDDEMERLAHSIADNGWTMPIVVHAEEMYIIDGEQRWHASEALDDPDLTPPGVPNDHVPVYGITVEEEQAQLATVQHNRARGNVEVDRLQDYLQDLDDRGVLDSVHDRIGYGRDEAAEILGDLSPSSVDDPMPWEEEEEPEVIESETEEEGVDESEGEPELPELVVSRTQALRGDVDEEMLANASTTSHTFTESEFEIVGEALGSEQRSQSLINIVDYVLATDSIGTLVAYGGDD